MSSINSIWSISPYLHHAIALRPDTGTDDPGRSFAINHAALVAEAFGGVPEDAVGRRAYDTVMDALNYYSAAFAAEPNLLKQAVRGIPSSATDLSQVTAQSGTRPKAVLGIIDENVPLDSRVYGDQLASIWVQQGAPVGTQNQWLPFGYQFHGTDLSETQKEAEKQGMNPTRVAGDLAYGAKGLERRKLRLFERFAHGAAVLGKAMEYVDDRTPLAMVGLPSLAVRDTSGRLLPYFIVTGLLYLMAVTRQMSQSLQDGGCGFGDGLPVVVNLSFGILAGPKDGTGRLEEVFDAICDPHLNVPDLGPVHLVVPMGNARQAQCRAVVPSASETQELGLLLQPDDKTPTYVEIRTTGDAQANIELVRPGCGTGAMLPTYTGQDVVSLSDSSGVTVYHEVETTADGQTRHLRILAFAPTANPHLGGPEAPAGTWRLRVQSGSPEVTMGVQRDDSLVGLGSGGRQARFSHPTYQVYGDDERIILDDLDETCPIKRRGTANAYASATHVWRVGGVYQEVSPDDPDGSIVPYSGFAASDPGDRPIAGDLLAPCETRKARFGTLANSMGGSFKLRTNGTSLASPIVAACLARGLANGVDRDGLGDFVDQVLNDPIVCDPKGAFPY